MANIALIVLDTLRKDYFDEYFEWLPGTTFDHAWSTSHATVPAHASLFTGLYASETGVYPRAPTFDFSGETLAEQLSAAGYRTTGYSCNPFITDTFSFTDGFDEMKRNWSSRRLDDDIFDWGDFESDRTFQGPLRFPEAIWRVVRSDCDTKESLRHGVFRKLYHDNSRLVSGDKGAKNVLKHLRRATFGDDEFFFANLMEAHGPYRVPQEYQTVTETNDGSTFADVLSFETPRPEQTRQAYEDCVRYLSDVYRDIFAELSEQFEYVITIADHGEQLGEAGCWGHNYGLHPTLTNVPYNVYASTGENPCSEDATVSILDAYATVLGRAGLKSTRRGVDLFEEAPDGARLTEYHGIFQADVPGRMREQGYDDETIDRYDEWQWGIALPTNYYGYETVDGFEERGSADEPHPRERLGEIRDDLDVRSVREDLDYADSVKEELEYLGYL